MRGRNRKGGGGKREWLLGATRSGVPCQANLCTPTGKGGRRGANGKPSSGRHESGGAAGWDVGWSWQMLIAVFSQESMRRQGEVAETACSCQVMCDAVHLAKWDWDYLCRERSLWGAQRTSHPSIAYWESPLFHLDSFFPHITFF